MKNEWINADERKPETADTVLVWHKGNQKAYFDQYFPVQKCWFHHSLYQITHWQPILPPLPPPPKE